VRGHVSSGVLGQASSTRHLLLILLIIVLDVIQLMRDGSTDTPPIITILPTPPATPKPPSSRSSSFKAADFCTNCLDNSISRLIVSCSAIVPSSAWTFSTWVASDDCVSCCCVWRALSAGKLMMMMMLNGCWACSGCSDRSGF